MTFFDFSIEFFNRNKVDEWFEIWNETNRNDNVAVLHRRHGDDLTFSILRNSVKMSKPVSYRFNVEPLVGRGTFFLVEYLEAPKTRKSHVHTSL